MKRLLYLSNKVNCFVTIFPALAFFLLFFADMTSPRELNDYEIRDLHSKIKRLDLAFEHDNINEFIREKGILRNQLKLLYNSGTLNSSVKKNVRALMIFMFPEDLSDYLFLNTKPSRRMKKIEESPLEYRAQIEFKLLEREAYLDMAGSKDEKIPGIHKKVLEIYRKIAGIERKTEPPGGAFGGGNNR